MKPSDYNYDFDAARIAHAPAEPRDSSRLLIYSTRTDEIALDTFANIARYLPAGSLLVLNDTQVVPARLECAKVTGGAVRILFLFNEWDRSGSIRGLPDRKISIGDALYVDHRPILEAVSQKNEEFTFKLLIPADAFTKLCAEKGRTPLPPYIRPVLDEQETRRKYQTIFADKPASVAAPTASLHFTDRVFASLAEKHIETAHVTLHVGRGTFSPVTDEMARSGSLHAEPIDISKDSSERIAQAKREGRTVIAAGTTSVRLLESAAERVLAGEPFSGESTMLIQPPYSFKVVDALITNFHIPKTSLLMLVDAFLQAKGARKTWRDLYEVAMREKFRFYSFGDAMLIL